MIIIPTNVVASSLANIRRCAQQTAAILECPTPEVLQCVAQIPEDTWRAFMVALRYSDDDRPLRREVGIL